MTNKEKTFILTENDIMIIHQALYKGISKNNKDEYLNTAKKLNYNGNFDIITNKSLINDSDYKFKDYYILIHKISNNHYTCYCSDSEKIKTSDIQNCHIFNNYQNAVNKTKKLKQLYNYDFTVVKYRYYYKYYDTCLWSYNDDFCYYDTQCEHSFQLNNLESLSENDFVFCPFCEKNIRIYGGKK